MMRRLLWMGIVLAVGAGLAWLGYQTYKEFRRGEEIKQAIAQVEQEEGRIRQENATLKDDIAYFQTSDFQEREAKEKLNYQETGEHVVIFQPGAAPTDNKVSFSEHSGATDTVIFRKPNYRLWWEQFFDF